MAAQFVVGIWEYHVNVLDEAFAKDMEEYTPFLAKEAFDHVPQLRTVPVGKSINAGIEVLPYEAAEEMVRKTEEVSGGSLYLPQGISVKRARGATNSWKPASSSAGAPTTTNVTGLDG